MGGGKRGHAHVVVPYREEWPVLYEREADSVKRILRDELLYLEHVGSTSIKGFGGNPVVDIVAIVRDLARIPLYFAALRRAGYHEVRPCPIVGSLLFRKEVVENGNWEHVANLHLFPDEHPRMADMIDIRDYLRAHPDEARKYEEMNRKLSAKHSDFETYTEKKEEYLHELSKRAAKWRGRIVEEEYGLV